MLFIAPNSFNLLQIKVVDKELELKILGQVIKKLREERKLSQAKLGLKIFKDQQSIQKAETGKFNPTYIYLLEICKGLEISMSEFHAKIEALRNSSDKRKQKS